LHEDSPDGLSWPPKKVDLDRLYLIDNPATMKVAEAYGLDYKSPKVAESTILYHLKRNGIKRRNSAFLGGARGRNDVDLASFSTRSPR